MKKLLIVLIVLVTVSCDKVDDMSLNGQIFSQLYPKRNCYDYMEFNKNTVTMTYTDCWEDKDGWDITASESTYNYTYKNGILVIDGLKVLSASIGYGNLDNIMIKRNNDVGYAVFYRINKW